MSRSNRGNSVVAVREDMASADENSEIRHGTLAKNLVRVYRGGTFAQEAADGLLRRNGVEDTDAAFTRMEKAGYLMKADIDDPGYVGWEATTLGNALAMARSGTHHTTDGGPPQSPACWNG